MAEKENNVIIHGHFYQPPRENPWTGRIEAQESAQPFHDWNDRITTECYLPNSCSRLLDGGGGILGLVNNYRGISFNFGPTILRWLEKHYPGLVEVIVRADAESKEQNSGHGNAIAQVYNHIIMPLASERDQRTQIEWGLADFRRVFGRDSEGIWLAETAVNDLTVDILVDYGVRFIILSPHQAGSVRPLDGDGEWKDVSDGSIQTGRCYLCRGTGSDRGINIFFYDSPLATDIAFNGLLRDGDRLAEALQAGLERGGGDLVTVATDGEVFGHHEPFGDMALAYLIANSRSKFGFRMTNFGSYLDTCQPELEVRLKGGENGEGTAWSCSHGVGRWKRDCGCNVNAPADWDQKWREPLRKGMNRLRDMLASIFEKEAGGQLSDPWKARDEYINLLNEDSDSSSNEFLQKYASGELDRDSAPRLLQLLESQRYSMYMFTSCGWFFNDISGLEARQILKYAARAISLAGERHRETLEEELFRILSKARSNIDTLGTGADIYHNTVKYTRVTPLFLAGQYIHSLLLPSPEISPESFGYRFSETDRQTTERNGHTITTGIVEVESPLFEKTHSFQYLFIRRDELRNICMLKPDGEAGGIEQSSLELDQLHEDADREDMLHFAVDHFGGSLFSIRDLFPDDRNRVLRELTVSKLDSLESLLEKVYLENRDFLRVLDQSSLPKPEVIESVASAYLERKLEDALQHWQGSLSPDSMEGIAVVLRSASNYGVRVDSSTASEHISEYLLELLRGISLLSTRECGEIIQFVDHVRGTEIEIRDQLIQNEIYRLLEAGFKKPDQVPAEDLQCILQLAERFNFNTLRWKELLQK
ncbi:MAG: DUF3536 domain-containing protein [Candidatus Latescibacteria bacterium]|nr:DUF3536 domain-containing protein [bacterium]MBD3422860.1 DUF3536 domain-containing protein [Candidatus Latescibacterota bacterium]